MHEHDDDLESEVVEGEEIESDGFNVDEEDADADQATEPATGDEETHEDTDETEL